jgi:hypothetical protein
MSDFWYGFAVGSVLGFFAGVAYVAAIIGKD